MWVATALPVGQSLPPRLPYFHSSRALDPSPLASTCPPTSNSRARPQQRMVQPVSTYRTAASPPFQSRLPPPHFSLPARPPAPTARLVPHLPPTTNSGGIEVIQRRREQLEVQQEWQAGARSSSTSRSSSERASQQGKEEGAAGGELRQASEGTMKLVGAAPMEAQTSSERSSGAPSVEVRLRGLAAATRDLAS